MNQIYIFKKVTEFIQCIDKKIDDYNKLREFGRVVKASDLGLLKAISGLPCKHSDIYGCAGSNPVALIIFCISSFLNCFLPVFFFFIFLPWLINEGIPIRNFVVFQSGVNDQQY